MDFVVGSRSDGIVGRGDEQKTAIKPHLSLTTTDVIRARAPRVTVTRLDGNLEIWFTATGRDPTSFVYSTLR